MNELKKCSGCSEIKDIVSCDGYGQYCNSCSKLNWLDDNDLHVW